METNNKTAPVTGQSDQNSISLDLMGRMKLHGMAEAFRESLAYEEYQIAINTHNRQLKRLSKMLPAGCKLTSYTSRHSWPTAARNHNVPISVISAGMGHTSEQTTQIYLTMLEKLVIDDANQGLIKSLLE